MEVVDIDPVLKEGLPLSIAMESEILEARSRQAAFVLEAIAKQRVVSTWVDFVLWLDEHKDDEGDFEVELCPELQELVETMNTEVYF